MAKHNFSLSTQDFRPHSDFPLRHLICLSLAPKKLALSSMVSKILCFSSIFPITSSPIPNSLSPVHLPSYECHLRLKPRSSIPPSDDAVERPLGFSYPSTLIGFKTPYYLLSNIIPFGCATIACVGSSPQEADAKMELKYRKLRVGEGRGGRRQ